MHPCMHGYMDACIHYRKESWQALFFNNLQIELACIHGCMHPWMHACTHPCMHGCSVKSTVYGYTPEIFLLKCAEKKVRYALASIWIWDGIVCGEGHNPKQPFPDFDADQILMGED